MSLGRFLRPHITHPEIFIWGWFWVPRNGETDQQRVELQVVGTGMNTDSLIQAAIKSERMPVKKRSHTAKCGAFLIGTVLL